MNRYQEKLIKNIETRLRTIMIGSLSKVEENFGYLWNHGSDMKSKDEQNFAEKWENLRIEILNHGNHQLRSAMDELHDFFTSKQDKYKYNYHFTFKDRR